MGSPWKAPEWMKPYFPFIGIPDLEKVMTEYSGPTGLASASPEGQAMMANAQVGLLVALHAAGLLKETAGAADKVR